MGKKTEKPVVAPAKAIAKPATKAAPVAPAALAKEIVIKKSVAKAAPVAKSVVTTKAVVAKAAPKAAPKAKPAAKKVAAPTFEEIQKQAYFVAERRLVNGLQGDSASDWIQAEKELISAAQ